MARSIYVDCEWRIPQQLFLIGYAYNSTQKGCLYGRRINARSFMAILKGVKYIYVYGPDIGVLENQLGVKLREKYICINLLTFFRAHVTRVKDHKLATIEKKFKIGRRVDKYKRNMRLIYSDWNHPQRRQHVLDYNMDDAVNLYLVKRAVCQKYGLTIRDIVKARMT